MIRKISIIMAILLMLLVPTVVFAENNTPLPGAKVHHYLLKDGRNGTIQVSEVLQWSVTGDVPSGNIEIGLPTGATEVFVSGGNLQQNIAGNELEQNGDKLVTPFKWTKGTNEVSITYGLPVTGNKAVLSTQLVYANEMVYVLAPSKELSIASKQLQDMGVQSMQSTEYRVFGGQNIPSGVGIEIEVSLGGSAQGGPGAVSRTSPTGKIDFHSPEHLRRWNSSPIAGTDPHIWLVFLAVLVVTFFTALTLYIRKKMKETREKEEEEKLHKLFLSLQARQRKLLNNLAQIDDQLEKTPQDEELLNKKAAVWELLREVKSKIKVVEETLDEQ